MDEINKKVEDIFSGIDKVETAPQIVAGVNNSAKETPVGNVPAASNKKSYFIVAIAVLIVAAIVAAVFLVIKSGVFTKTPATEKKATQAETPAGEQNSASSPVDLAEPDSAAAAKGQAAIDSDSDGLSDEKEKELGANPLKPDTDNDGLFDGEEVNFYKTDPLNPDTDGDRYLDGEEVKGGYNPKGSGQLLNFDEAKKALNK